MWRGLARRRFRPVASRSRLLDSSIVATTTENEEGLLKVYKDHNLHLLFGVAQGINLPNVFSLLSSHAPSENRGAFMATNGMVLRAGQTIGPLLVAGPASSLGLTGAYLAAALAALTFLVALVLFR